jgi:endoglucanase
MLRARVTRTRFIVVCAALLFVVSVGTVGVLRSTNAKAAASTLAVSGNHLVDNGKTVILRGVNRSGSEYACWQGYGFFDGPSDDASVAAIAAWGTNAVRVPINEDCWLGINGINPTYAGANYQAAITAFVGRLRSHGLYVLISNQTAGPGTTVATTILPMPDADHAPTMWASVASAFASDKGVIFDLYNEPHDVSWSCWANGCQVTGGVNFVTPYQAAGMNSLTAAIRGTGATNVINIAGLSWSYDISGWLANRPSDGQLIAGIHNYGVSGWDTPAIWDNIYAPTALQVPVIFGEMGFDGYIEKIMPWADAHGIGYLAWTWDTWGNQEALISNYNGTPTTYGTGFKNYLAGLPTTTPTPSPTPTPTPSPSPTPAGPTVSSVAPNNGPTGGGTSVTITGNNFTGATAVKFGTAAAGTFAVNNATQIMATSPAGSGTVDVTVTTPNGTSPTGAADHFAYTSSCSAGSTPVTLTASSTSQYSLANSDGSTWQEISAANLRLYCNPSASQSTLLTANADLFTANVGFNQDLGIFVSDNGGADQRLAWKESGGYAGTFSPNAAFIQYLFNMTSGHAYVFKLKWKTNKPASGATIFAGAGSGTFSPTSLVAETFPSAPMFAVSTMQYTLTNSDGATWQAIDAAHLNVTLSPGANGTAVLGGNADLFTGNAGFNQDLGIFVSDNGGADGLVAWKESGGFAGTFSPNAAFAKATYPVSSGHTYVFKLKWKANRNAMGATIFAGAGSGTFSQTSLFVGGIAAGANPYSAVSTSQYGLANSNGTTWQPIDAALNVTVAPGADTNSILGGNIDLWTANAGFNQDIGIFVSDNAGADALLAWKESGGFAGTFSPNAAFVQATYHMTSGHTYVFKLKWKTNKNASGATIYAAAGGPAPFSATRLVVELTG